MNYNDFCGWLVSDKSMSQRAAKDVLSRCRRVCKMTGEEDISDETKEKLVLVESFGDSSMFVKSQLKRAVALANEFRRIK